MGIKLTKRKAFNFLRSYFDVLNDIPEDSDKLSFLMAIINKQFLNEDPKDLNFITNLCYNSQRHAVEKSVKGWETANKIALPCGIAPPPKGDPTLPPKGDPLTPCQEEEEKEQVQEKEEEEEKGQFDFIDKYIIEIGKTNGHDQWKDSFYMNYKLKNGSLSKMLLNFKTAQILLSTMKDKGINEFKIHFFNWMNIQERNGLLTDFKKK